MSEEPTQNMPDGRSFEERVFARFDDIAAHLSGMDARLTNLEEKVDRRLQETRPIWEQVLERLDGVETRLEGVETRLNGIDTRLENVESELHDLNRKFRVFNADILKLQDNQDDLEERVRKLESEPAQ